MGTGGAWSGLYQLRSLLYTAGYPATAGFGLALLTLAGMHRLLRHEARWWGYAALAAGTAVTFANHRMTAAFLLLAGVLLARRRATDRFFSAGTAPAERVEIARGLGVTHVLWRDDDVSPDVAGALLAAGADPVWAGDFTLVRWPPETHSAPPATSSVN